jgi:hypothetical protein
MKLQSAMGKAAMVQAMSKVAMESVMLGMALMSAEPVMGAWQSSLGGLRWHGLERCLWDSDLESPWRSKLEFVLGWESFEFHLRSRAPKSFVLPW